MHQALKTINIKKVVPEELLLFSAILSQRSEVTK